MENQGVPPRIGTAGTGWHAWARLGRKLHNGHSKCMTKHDAVIWDGQNCSSTLAGDENAQENL